jgi:hypothetical protein
MHRFKSVAAVLTLLAAASAARAQYAVGDTMPAPTLDGFAQTGATSVGDLAGRAVLYKFFAFW